MHSWLPYSRYRNTIAGRVRMHSSVVVRLMTLNESDIYTLLPGDTMTFKATTPHRYANNSNKRTVVLWVHTA